MNEDVRDNTNTVVFHTPSYSKNDRQKIINQNNHPVTHPYFTEYRPLQRLCLKILKSEKLSFGENDEKIHGLLFDGALLWENYIAKVFQDHCPSIQHKTHRDNLFKDGQGIIPDFIIYQEKPFTASLISDTKYKFIDTRNEAAREDYYQLITYMYRYSCKTSCILFPFTGNDETYLKGKKRIINNKGQDSKLIELGLRVPQEAADFDDFCGQMKEAESHFVEAVQQNIAVQP
jgi:5-methylcytosine-specific restriction endonuclease McrBC regulatory subunit McrC